MRKKWLSVVIGAILLLGIVGMMSTVALAKYEADITVEISGQVAEWNMYGHPLVIEIEPEYLYPGCEYEIEITITNNSDVPAELEEIIIEGCPGFLQIDFPTTADWLDAGEAGETEIRLSIDESETEEIAGELIYLEIIFHYEQGV